MTCVGKNTSASSLMLAFLAIPLLLAAQEPPPTRPDSVAEAGPADSAAAEPARDPLPRLTVTAAHLASAFEDARARELLARARAARLQQDSAIVSYDAMAQTRFSFAVRMTAIGRERLVIRHENATRVRWQRDAGLHIQPVAGRSTLPVVHGARVMSTPTTDPPIPYYPGKETLMLMSNHKVREDATEDEIVHPIARGAEAYYRYATGDSIAIRLPDGREVRLIELRFRARRPHWRLVVGSVWIDEQSAQIVRGAFRLAVPIQLWEILDVEGEAEEIPRAVRPMLRSASGSITAVLIEHGLYEGLYWLPRVVSVEGEVKALGMRGTARYAHTFEYASVNERLDGMPRRPAVTAQQRDTLLADSLGLTGAPRDSLFKAQRRSRRVARREAERTRCEDTAASYRYANIQHGIYTVIDMPCDTVSFVTHPILPPSIFEATEELFTEADREGMMSALGFEAQAEWEPQPPVIRYGIGDGLLRFNRVEGLSAGVIGEQRLGRGLTADARLQLGIADLQPNGELGLSRTDLRREFRIGAYRRLVAADDWGSPFSLGASLSALLFARDDAIYYRAWGVELTGRESSDSQASWRIFAERHDPARVETQRSLPNLLSGREFSGNIEAERRTSIGASARVHHTLGWNPRGMRTFLDMRVEGAAGGAMYGRLAGDATFSRGIGDVLAASVTLSAGSSIGALPIQRQWFLGGSHTIRGQEPGAAVGDSYWMGRVELGGSRTGARPVVFYDMGWAGDRGEWGRTAVPVSGAGIGLSFLDGVARLDLAAGMRPSRGLQLRLYLDSRF